MSRGTFSKHPSRYPAGTPVQILCGKECWVWDCGGHKYLDLPMGLAAAGVLGHGAVADVIAAVMGTVFHLPSVHEEAAANQLLEFLGRPWAEDVRFALNGTDVTAGAIRLARAVTGVVPVITFKGAYHGASGADWFAAGQSPARGIDLNNVIAPTVCIWNDVESLNSVDYPVAAIIFEVGETAPTPEFVAALHATRDKHRCVLIADEVVTGFRLHQAGACGLYNIQPDLACYGKALGSGVPISALVGKRNLMKEFDLVHTNEPVFMSYTHGANVLGLAAMAETLRRLNDGDVIWGIWEIGQAMIDAFEECAKACNLQEITHTTGQAPRHLWRFHDTPGVTGVELTALFWQRMCTCGVLVGTANCPTIHHDKGMKRLCGALNFALGIVAKAVKRGSVAGFLEGEVPTPLYVRRKT